MPDITADDLARLIDRHAAALVLYARQICHAPDDVVQETFLALARQRELPPEPAAWLFRTVRNGALTATRAARRRDKHEQAAAALKLNWFEPTTETVFDADVAQQTLASLPADEREVIIAHLWGGLTFAQIAAVTQQSAATCHRRYAAGLQTLREKLQPREPSDNSNSAATRRTEIAPHRGARM